ncbi:hypothetical protein D8674_012244 [Pyrus ussuriensis x Pyrus communis]|uniref:Uncharacterized protein n=1 Tax=Pyrus ussuriensis x Pyrus communis TaxID=2448454 RepID=A0A5N5G127_9ROSA|nr:hypothetical protein D8674_012244 [Pyrus ussuriensis x Pyrus communis]
MSVLNRRIKHGGVSPWTTTLMITIMTVTTAVRLINGCNNNNVYLSCTDTTVKKSDGFTFELLSPPRTPFNEAAL